MPKKNNEEYYVDVLLPLPISGLYTYKLPKEWVEMLKGEGQRLAVPFGRHKVYSALSRKVHQNKPDYPEIKEVLAVLDEEAIVSSLQFQFWDWISRYYMSYPGEVMNVALPSAFKLNSETHISLHPLFEGEISSLNPKELLIVTALTHRPELSISEVEKICGQSKIYPLVKGLREKEFILVQEEIRQRFKPKMENYLAFGENYAGNEAAQKDLFDTLEKKAYAQLQVLMAFVELLYKQDKNIEDSEKWVLQADLIKKCSSSRAAIPALIKKGVLQSKQKMSSRIKDYNASEKVDNIQLSDYQEKAHQEILQSFEKKNVCLLHGITSSGKTEIYIKLIEKTLQEGKQVLYLLPEIALTTQMIDRLRKYFGNSVGVYHSRYSEHEKMEIWKKTNTQYKIILGARSALFMPFQNLGLVIIDEEHETSFKQFDPSPRYHARDAAIVLASLHRAKTLLGSATPSMESFFNAVQQKYALVSLNKRYGKAVLPEIFVADMKKEPKRKDITSYFSSFLLEKMEEALENKQQIILFQNRRGFSPRIECDTCHYMPGCKHCDVSLSYHKSTHRLHCHYCGYTEVSPSICPQCGRKTLSLRGFGTEKIEEDLALILPQAKVGRMDYDSTRAKNAYKQIIDDFANRKIDILVGTQMVTKGLDFDNVSVVGVLNADNLICFPDFRAYERSFQMLTQVSGRAGRKQEKACVVIQSYNPYYQVIQDVINQDYYSMYKSQMEERQVFKYPPYYRLIRFSLKHPKQELVNQGAAVLAKMLHQAFGNRVLGPDYPLVSRVQNYYIKNILLKFERELSVEAAKKKLAEVLSSFEGLAAYRSLRVNIDVDPY